MDRNKVVQDKRFPGFLFVTTCLRLSLAGESLSALFCRCGKAGRIKDPDYWMELAYDGFFIPIAARSHPNPGPSDPCDRRGKPTACICV